MPFHVLNFLQDIASHSKSQQCPGQEHAVPGQPEVASAANLGDSMLLLGMNGLKCISWDDHAQAGFDHTATKPTRLMENAKRFGLESLVASLLLVAMPGAPSLLLVAMPFAPSSVLAPRSFFSSGNEVCNPQLVFDEFASRHPVSHTQPEEDSHAQTAASKKPNRHPKLQILLILFHANQHCCVMSDPLASPTRFAPWGLALVCFVNLNFTKQDKQVSCHTANTVGSNLFILALCWECLVNCVLYTGQCLPSLSASLSMPTSKQHMNSFGFVQHRL